MTDREIIELIDKSIAEEFELDEAQMKPEALLFVLFFYHDIAELNVTNPKYDQNVHETKPDNPNHKD